MFRKTDSPLSASEENLVYKIIGCAIEVHRELGPGFRERIYHTALAIELDSMKLRFEMEKPITVAYKQLAIPGQKIDLIVEDAVIVEIKSVRRLREIHEAQLQSYLRTMRLHAGLLLNFNQLTMKAGTRRVVLSTRRVGHDEQT
jgi:GxxExxY protein